MNYITSKSAIDGIVLAHLQAFRSLNSKAELLEFLASDNLVDLMLEIRAESDEIDSIEPEFVVRSLARIERSLDC